HVAGIVPRPPEDLGRAFRLVPVLLHHPRMAVAAHAEHALLPGRHRLQVVVEDVDAGPGAGTAAAARLDRLTGAVETLDHALAHADAVQHGDAEAAADGLEGVGRQRLAGADAVPPARQVAVPGGAGVGHEHAVDRRRGGEVADAVLREEREPALGVEAAALRV